MNLDDIDRLTGLLRRLLESYIDYPRDLSVEFRTLPRRINWEVRANINDQGKLVGKKGAHIKAVQWLMGEIGTRRGLRFVVILEESDGDIGPEITHRSVSPTYSPTPAMRVLEAFLGELLDATPGVSVERESPMGSVKPSFIFRITPKSHADDERLQSPLAPHGTQTIMGELSTLFAAAGNRDGVNFKLEVAK